MHRDSLWETASDSTAGRAVAAGASEGQSCGLAGKRSADTRRGWLSTTIPMTDDLAHLAADPQARDATFEAWFDEGDVPALLDAVAWAARRGDVDSLLALAGLAGHEGEEDVVSAVRSAMGPVRPQVLHATEALLTASGESCRLGARLAVLLRLPELGSALVDALAHPYFLARADAASALGQLGVRAGVEALRDTCLDIDVHVGLAAVEALARMDDPQLQRALLGGFSDDGLAYYRGFADVAGSELQRAAVRVLVEHEPSARHTILDAWLERAEDAADAELIAMIRDAIRA